MKPLRELRMKKKISKAGFVLLALLCIPIGLVKADVSTDVAIRRAQLENDLGQLEKDIEAQRKLLQGKQRESVSLERDIAILDVQIEKSKLEIKARKLAIEKLSGEIEGKVEKIDELSDKMSREISSLSELMRKTNEVGYFTLTEVLLTDQNLSQFFQDTDSFETVQRNLHTSLGTVKDTKEKTEEAKNNLEEKKAEEQELKGIQELEKKRIEEKESEKKRLLKTTRGKEKEYKKILAQREKDAALIRSELFNLSGTAAIPFGKALELANLAYQKTGVRPALLLGVIAEESNLGQNVGRGNWKTDMHPTRDQPVFQVITSRLGLDPDKMPVSKKAWYGWGGAMGPAQFIPSTWILYQDRITALTGNNPPSPWDPKDGFMAAALLLKDNGAIYGNYDSERLAALRYLAGYKNAKKKAYAFYGDDVMGLARKYEQEIAILQRG